MRKTILLSILFLLASCAYQYNPYFAPENIVQTINMHSVSIAVYYSESATATAYLGSGTIIANNYVITVAHLFDHGTPSKIWVVRPGDDHFIEAELICMTLRTEENWTEDYAIIRLKENLGLPGIPIAIKDAKQGEKVIFAGTVGGMCITRFGHVTNFKWFFKRGDNGGLALGFWDEDMFLAVFPGGNGDSGGGIFNIKGQLVGIMYCGVSNHNETYIFSNRLWKLWRFINGLQMP